MAIISVRIDEETKAKMDLYKDINWSEVLRDAIRRRVEVEEALRRKDFDVARALKASEHIEKLRAKTTGEWSGVKEIRKWRDTRR